MTNVYIGTILSHTNDWYYSFDINVYSFESLEEVSRKATKVAKQLSGFEPNMSEIIVKHYVEGYEGDDPYLNLVQKFKSATYQLNYLGEVIESYFGTNRDFILSDFTDPENRFAVGDICDIYLTTCTGPVFYGSGIVTGLRPDPHALPLITNPGCYHPGYRMTTISSDGCIRPEDSGFPQESLRRVARATVSPEYFEAQKHSITREGSL